MAKNDRIAGVNLREDVLAADAVLASSLDDVIISEIVEGSSLNKAVELYNPTGSAIDLAAAGYVLSFYFNGAVSAGTVIALSGTIEPGETFVIADDGADPAVLAVADQISTANFFNGDDAIVLTRDGTIIDSFGQVGFDPGSEWPGGGQNDTLRRLTAPDADPSDPFVTTAQWEVLPQDTFDGLGSFTAAEEPPTSPTLVINEILADPATGPVGDANGDGTRDATQDEFVEIVNGGTGTADLSGATLADGFGTRHVFADGTTLGAGERIVVFGGGTPTGDFGGAQVVTASTGALGLNNGGDTVTLASADGSVIYDQVVYGGEGGEDQSLTRSPEVTGPFVLHSTVTDAGLFSPGTQAEGSAPPPPEAPLLLISEVQGDGAESPVKDTVVTIEAVVVGDFQDGSAGTDGDLNGFFLQEEDADADGNPLTSEGIFVFDGSSPAVNVEVGQLVRVTGTVVEFFGKTELTSLLNVEVISPQVELPTAATVTFPTANMVDTGSGLVADLEMYEGMLVTIPQELTVGDVFNLGRFGEIDLNALGRVPTYTQIAEPSVEGFQDYIETAVRNAIVLDDGRTVQNPADIPFEIAGEDGTLPGIYDAGDELGSGDTIMGLTGVLDYSFSQYRLQPTDPVEFVNANPREEEPPEVGGRLQVATFNVLNYFTTLDQGGATTGPGGDSPRGADSEVEFERQTDKLIAALGELRADVFGLIEIENEFTDANDDGEVAIATLVAELNSYVPGASYTFVDPGTTFVGDDVISVGLIYNSQTVKLAEGTSVEFLTDADLSDLGLDFIDPIFTGTSTSRSPLAASFEELSTGEVFTVAVNHFKSKGSPSAIPGDVDAGDGAGASNEARLKAAIALDAWLDTDPTGSGDPDVLITGDLNAYAMEAPVQYLLNEGYVNLLSEFGDGFDYTYGFPLDLGEAGQVQGFGTLDYALASRSLARQVTGAEAWNINADEPSVIDYNTEFKPNERLEDFYEPDPFRSSDHDPVLVGLDLITRDLVLGRVGSGRIFGTNADEIIDGQGGQADLARGFLGSDIFRFTNIVGQRDKLIVADYMPGVDLLDLSGETISEVRSVGRNLEMYLDGDDGDNLLIRKVSDIDQITFVDDPFLS